ncbi:MAG TPA: condensation domain-containing protein, partial [Thermoanaerobaculia bacterium]|nr:condensation domain-containing protein [Thermoanaerobaculia bacterium]
MHALDSERDLLPSLEEASPAEEVFVFPVSFAQWRLWFLDQLHPGSSAYNIAASVRLSGALDTAALTRALEEIVRRHEALRTTFALEDGQPVQRVVSRTNLELPVVDLEERYADSTERRAHARRLTEEEASRPMKRNPCGRDRRKPIDGT